MREVKPYEALNDPRAVQAKLTELYKKPELRHEDLVRAIADTYTTVVGTFGSNPETRITNYHSDRVAKTLRRIPARIAHVELGIDFSNPTPDKPYLRSEFIPDTYWGDKFEFRDDGNEGQLFSLDGENKLRTHQEPLSQHERHEIIYSLGYGIEQLHKTTIRQMEKEAKKSALIQSLKEKGILIATLGGLVGLGQALPDGNPIYFGAIALGTIGIGAISIRDDNRPNQLARNLQEIHQVHDLPYTFSAKG